MRLTVRLSRILAERGGFEPPCPLRQTDFESDRQFRLSRILLELNGSKQIPKMPV